MYALHLKGNVDLVAGERPCSRCAYCVDLKLGIGSMDLGCSRHLALITHDPMPAADVRADASLCGGRGWVDLDDASNTGGGTPGAGITSGGAICLGARGVECAACRFVLPEYTRHGSDRAPSCSRFADEVGGHPLSCADARFDAAICGPAGGSFEPKLGRPVAGDLEIIANPHLINHAAGTNAVALLEHVTSIGDQAADVEALWSDD